MISAALALISVCQHTAPALQAPLGWAHTPWEQTAVPGADPTVPRNTRDVPRINPQELQSPGMVTSHSHTCARGAATMRTALTRHIPLVLIEMKGSGKIVISGENLKSPDICDSKPNHFFFFFFFSRV